MSGIGETCSDDRFDLIAKAKAELLDATNIESSPTDMAALDSILFRCWQMGWLDRLCMGERETINKTGDIVTHDSGECENVWDVELTGRLRFQCSECGAVSLEITPRFCPNCGKKVAFQ